MRGVFCNITLASYSYNSSNGKLARISYGNGFAVNYYYDSLDRISEIVYNRNGSYETVMSYSYDSGGRLYSSTDHRTGETVRYDYDPSGKLLASYVANSSGNVLGGASYEYDENGRISESDVRIDVSGSIEREELSYSYNRDGNLSLRVSVNGSLIGNITPTYDTLDRTTQRTLDYYAGGDVFYGKVSYSYLQRNGYQTALVSRYTFERGVSGTLTSSTYNFTYDLAGNITQITDGSGTVQNRYEYDDLYQLIREDNRALGKTYVWTYDNAGNILSKTTYAFTTGALGAAQETLTYTYSNGSWGDQLTNVSGWTYTYDAIGNPISKTNSNGETVEFTWSGRELASWYLYDDEELIKPMSFTYNADGIRTSKSYYDEVTEYILDGSRIIAEVKGSDIFVYIYDETGSPIGIKYRSSTTSSYEYFFFEKNLQGDIVSIYNDSGTKIASYVYDAWGNFTKTQTSGVTHSTADTFVYNNNPFTYRGYYYDAETGLYYLQTRYYDASVGRFISPDTAEVITATPTELTDKNLYAYCDNNPVMRTDEDGEFWGTITGAIIGGIFGGINAALNGDDIWAGIGIGAVTGAVAGLAVDLSVATGGVAGLAIAAVGGAVANSASYAATEIANGREVDIGRFAAEATIGAAFNLLSFGAGGGSMAKATGSIWKNVCQNFKSTLFKNTTRMVAGKEAMKSSYGIIKNVLWNIGEQFGLTGVISGGLFGFSAGISRWSN